MKKYLIYTCLFALLLAAGTVSAADYGIVTDLEGEVRILRGADTVPAEIGESVAVGDRIEAGPKAILVLVSYARCQEWVLEGKNTFTVNEKAGPQPGEGKITPYREIPVCYNPDDFQDAASQKIGGYVLRGTDPVASLRKEFDAGNAPNSTLITLTLHDLKKGNVEKARPYFNELKGRVPDSSIVKKLAPRFK